MVVYDVIYKDNQALRGTYHSKKLAEDCAKRIQDQTGRELYI